MSNCTMGLFLGRHHQSWFQERDSGNESASFIGCYEVAQESGSKLVHQDKQP